MTRQIENANGTVQYGYSSSMVPPELSGRVTPAEFEIAWGKTLNKSCIGVMKALCSGLRCVGLQFYLAC